MKKVILALLLVFASTTTFSQTSSGVWNSKTATYTNSAHKITWHLIDDADWVARPILDESTLFKVRNDDAQILVRLGATKTKHSNEDVWDYVSMFESTEFTEPHRQLAAYNGMEYVGTKAVKSQLCGIHAVKTRTDMKKYYPEYKQTVHGIEIKYSLYRNGYIYTITVSALSVLEEEIADFERVATMIINGFKIK